MRVIILATTSHKAKIADQLIKSKAISKILISVGSKKLVTQAQAIIVYHECKEDLQKLKRLLKIYLGVPIKFYFGDSNHTKSDHFYTCEQQGQMVMDLLEEQKKMVDAADQIYKAMKGDREQLTVYDILCDMDENERDVIEEICVAFFAEKKEDKDPKNSKNVVVKENKFKKWWCEAKLDNFETIKFYLLDWITK